MLKVFKNKWLRFLILITVGIITFISFIIGILYLKQDAIVQLLLVSLNESYTSRIVIEDCKSWVREKINDYQQILYF